MTRMPVFFYSLVMLLICFSSYAFDDNTRVALYYGDNPPLEELHAFNVVVVSPQSKVSPKQYNNCYSQLYAYVNVGELEAHSDFNKQIQANWRKGDNAAWGSHIMDLSNPAWRDFLLTKVIDTQWQNGYRGFFLDTLDSYQLLKLSPEQKKEQQAGIIDFIKKIKTKYPSANIIVNRGFEVLDSIHQDISAIAAESLFAGWSSKTKTYQSVSDNDRKWLLNILNKAHQVYHLPVIVIDYVPPNERDKARQIAKQISVLGFIPWVTDAYLQTLGVGTIEVVPRRILLLYDNSLYIAKNRATAIAAFDYGAFPLQFMGFIPVVQPVDASLPEQFLKDRYAGIITWFSQPVIKNHLLLEKWLSKQVELGIPLVFMQNFGLPSKSPLLQRLNVKIDVNPNRIKKVAISHKDKDIGYEILPQPVPTDFVAVSNKNAKVLLKLSTDSKQEDAIAITPWGGYVLSPFDAVVLPNQESRWVVNPFKFFREALRLIEFPIPDVTTANGKRILTVHIDGDAFISRVPWMDSKYAGEVILEQIIKPYKLPTTVSIIQREFELIQKSPYLSERLIKTAQKIFALPWVQVATHTYSHPLAWGSLVEGKPNTDFLSYPDKNYLFSYKKEIAGSTEYINTHLAPANKKVVAVFWSGDANLQEGPLDITYQEGLKNINGMAKIFINRSKSITNLGALGMTVGNYFQVFAPIPNEFEYTDDWSQPLYAFQNVIHTFELTDKPVRYKPMSVYYHFYIATDQASLRSLKRVYNWALKQNVIPLQISDYINRVIAFNSTVIARSINRDDKSWLIVNNKNLREFRWPIDQGMPDLDKSTNVIGFNAYNKDYYIHLGSRDDTWIRFTQSSSQRPYLVEANAELIQWDIINKDLIKFSLHGYVPLNFKLANMQHCQLEHNKQLVQAVEAASDKSYKLKDANCGAFEIHCT